MLSTFDDDRDIAQSMRTGAKGYLLKDMPAPELAEAIRLVHRGYRQMAPGLMKKLLTNVPASGDYGVVEPLTMVFYTASQFPSQYKNDAFIAMHGSWNRKPRAVTRLCASASTTAVSLWQLSRF